MLTPRELEVLDVVGEVMQERLQEVRRDYEGRLSELAAKVAALEDRASEVARTKPDRVEVTRELSAATELQIAALHERFAALPPPISEAEILTLAQGALTSTRASLLEVLQVQMIDLFKALPIPEKGDKGDAGTDGASVTVEDFRGLFDASYARFELETERRIMDLVQRTLDRIPIPKDGADGKDGIGFDDLDVVQTGDRTIELRFARADKTKVFGFKFPWLIDRGVWKVGTVYETGDVVTWGGSSWIVVCDNPSGKPKDGISPDWRLMAKAGRDGKDGANGIKGDPGPAGKNGRDMTGRLIGSAGP